MKEFVKNINDALRSTRIRIRQLEAIALKETTDPVEKNKIKLTSIYYQTILESCVTFKDEIAESIEKTAPDTLNTFDYDDKRTLKEKLIEDDFEEEIYSTEPVNNYIVNKSIMDTKPVDNIPKVFDDSNLIDGTEDDIIGFGNDDIVDIKPEIQERIITNPISYLNEFGEKVEYTSNIPSNHKKRKRKQKRKLEESNDLEEISFDPISIDLGDNLE